jgi:L-lactate dehydrogenase
VILGDQRSLLTVCTPVEEIAGVGDVTISLPHLVGGAGILDTILLPLELEDDEESALRESTRTVKNAIESLEME